MTTAVLHHEPVVECPCGSLDPATEVFHTPTRRYVRCPSCHLVFLHPRPMRDTLEDYFRDDYDAAYGFVEASDDRKPVFRSVLKHVLDYRQPPGSLLDIGCGDGEFLLLCQQAGWHCSGIELSQRAAVRAAEKGLTILPPEVLEGSGSVGQFDVVTLINVLENVADPLSILKQASQVLAPGGLLFIRATNGAFHLPMRTPARWVGSQYDQAFHWYLYTSTSLRRLLESVGLTIVGLRNSRPSRGPLSPVYPWFSHLKWAITRMVLWPMSQVAYYATNGRLVCAPSFEIAARCPGGIP